jgi:hypothetical protein
VFHNEQQQLLYEQMLDELLVMMIWNNNVDVNVVIIHIDDQLEFLMMVNLQEYEQLNDNYQVPILYI